MIAYNRTRKGWLKIVLFIIVFALGMTLTFSGVDGADHDQHNQTAVSCNK